MLLFFDETFRSSLRDPTISLGAMCGIAIPQNDLSKISSDVYKLKLKHFGNEYASEREIKGKEIFKKHVFKIEDKGEKSRNLAFASDLLDYIEARQLKIFGCVCFERGIQKFEVANVALLDKTFRYIFERVDIYMKMHHHEDMAIMVFDDREYDTNKSNSEAITKFFQRSARGMAMDSIVATPLFAISQAQNIGLQLADFVTSIVGLRFCSHDRIKPYFARLRPAIFEYTTMEGLRISGLKVLRNPDK